MTTELPTWLTTRNDSHSPFSGQTRTHLLKRAAEDPRVGELVGRLHAKGEAEGTNERNWARRVCLEGHKIMGDLHRTFGPADEDDVLKLAAYMSDHSYAHFFTEYVNAPPGTGGEYHEMIRRISPILADLQPAVAIGFAPQIHEVFAAADKSPEAEALFLDLARQHPADVMKNYARLKGFANYEAIREVAQNAVEASAQDSPQQAKFAETVRARREMDAQTARFTGPD